MWKIYILFHAKLYKTQTLCYDQVKIDFYQKSTLSTLSMHGHHLHVVKFTTRGLGNLLYCYKDHHDQ